MRTYAQGVRPSVNICKGGASLERRLVLGSIESSVTGPLVRTLLAVPFVSPRTSGPMTSGPMTSGPQGEPQFMTLFCGSPFFSRALALVGTALFLSVFRGTAVLIRLSVVSLGIDGSRRVCPCRESFPRLGGKPLRKAPPGP